MTEQTAERKAILLREALLSPKEKRVSFERLNKPLKASLLRETPEALQDAENVAERDGRSQIEHEYKHRGRTSDGRRRGRTLDCTDAFERI